MSRAMRRFVLWLLITILPVQSYAAATMMACGPSHERMAAAAQSRSDAYGSSSHAGSHDHGSHDHSRAASYTPDPMTSDESARAVGDLGDFTCSACAACCVSAALPAGDVSLGLPAPAPGTLRPSQTTPLAAVALDGPERPPRSILA